MATLDQVITAFVAGEGDGMRASSVSVHGSTLYSYNYPLAYRGRDVNGNTTVFINTARTGQRVGDMPACWNMQNEHATKRDTAYSVTTSRHRRVLERAAQDADLNVIACDFDAYYDRGQSMPVALFAC